ncbi:MAG: NAD(P)-dependent oxidoreductase [Deltaproteobacteria bacterium]|nr:NAD(P)-dependent oxidoreductase [Deltaproteobacteria bacterium]
MKTLVTGATGFIGKHLVKTLVEQGKDVRCLVRKTSDTQYLDDLGVELFYGDLLNKDSLKDIAKNVNIVYHLAGEIYSNRSRDFYRVNFDGTRNLVEVCLPEKIERFVFLSSISAVGPNQKHGVLLNEQSSCNPIDPYGKSKLKAEKLLIQSLGKYKFPVIIVRAPTVYGPSGKSKILKKILDKINRGSFVTLGNGKNLRSMCYIDNLIQLLIKVERSSHSIGQIYFSADERPYTYNEIFKKVAEQSGTLLRVTHLPTWPGRICGSIFKLLSIMGFYSMPLYMAWHMVLDMACDISKAKEQLNYRPCVDIREGIEIAIKSFLKEEPV